MPDSSVSQSAIWPGPASSFPSLAPESSDAEDHFFRCPDCGELFAIGTWLRNGYLIECDVRGCNGQFYAKIGWGERSGQAQTLAPAGAVSATEKPTPDATSRGRA